MSDTFDIASFPVGCEVVIRTGEDTNVIGIVAAVDEGAQSVTFTDGRVYQFEDVEQ